jgi:predicted enzyme related to lactoylglutathione lyase
MKLATGLGGLFFKANDPKAMYEWYEKHLGVQSEPGGSGAMFHWRDAAEPDKTGLRSGQFSRRTPSIFAPSTAPFMMNFRVENLGALPQVLTEEGVAIDPKVEEYDYGKFAWITDPEGNRVELWEPPQQQ